MGLLHSSSDLDHPPGLGSRRRRSTSARGMHATTFSPAAAMRTCLPPGSRPLPSGTLRAGWSPCLVPVPVETNKRTQARHGGTLWLRPAKLRGSPHPHHMAAKLRPQIQVNESSRAAVLRRRVGGLLLTVGPTFGALSPRG